MEIIFKAVNPDNDKVANKFLFYCEYAIGIIVGLALLVAAIITPWEWKGLLPINAIYLLVSVIAFWVVNSERNRRNGWKNLKYVIGDTKIDPDPANCVPGIPGKRPLFKEITGIDLVLYESGKRNIDYLINYKTNLYYLIRWTTVLVPQKGVIVVHTSQKAPIGVGTNLYSFTPEDVDGFIDALKKKVDKKILVKTIKI
ncbi:MAG: hypothetical protein WCT31_05225 [Candidatus Micrarchaeia archaeon]|jgi:hypothetical protein